MLKIRKYPKRSPYWIIRGTVKGQPIFESSGTIDRREAEEFRRKREASLYEQIALGTLRPTTFADAVVAYINSGGEKKYLLKLLEYFGETPLTEIRQVDVDACAAKLYPSAKASTINRQCINQIITVIKHAADAEMPGVVRRKIKRRKEEKATVTPATDEHIEALLPHLPEGLRALITLMTFTGLRTGEALRVAPVDIRDSYIHISKTKNDEPRMVPVPHGWEWPLGGWGVSTTQGVGKALRRAHRAAGLPYRDGHELGRHAFAARWLRAGKGMKGLQIAGGWKKFSIPADIYGHLEITDVHQQMRELSKIRAKSVQPTETETVKTKSPKEKKGRCTKVTGPSLGRKRPRRACGASLPRRGHMAVRHGFRKRDRGRILHRWSNFAR